MAANLAKIYIETTCFVEMAKHAIGTGNPSRDTDIWHLKMLLQAAKDGKLEVYTATLTVAECQHAEEPSTTGMPANEVKTLFKNFLTSWQYLTLIQDTILVAEQARNLRWVHGICLSGPDSIHAASYMELRCDEFLSFDTAFHKKKAQLDGLAVKVRLPRNTAFLPNEYRQAMILRD